MASRICSNKGVDPEVRLSVYTFAYRARLQEVLANDYCALLMALGDKQFNQLVEDYIDTHPSRYYSLRDFGSHFPVFISELTQQHHSYQDKHWLYELALFEWTLGKAFDAPDSSILCEQEMADMPAELWPGLRFQLHPSVHRINFEWNTPQVWQALKQETPSQVTAQRGDSYPWLVWREQLVTRFRSVLDDEQLALDRLFAGGSFEEICEALSASMSEQEVPLRAASLLKHWIAQGLIAGLRI